MDEPTDLANVQSSSHHWEQTLINALLQAGKRGDWLSLSVCSNFFDDVLGTLFLFGLAIVRCINGNLSCHVFR